MVGGASLLNATGFKWAFLISAFLRITGSLAFLALIDRIEKKPHE